MMGGWWWYAVLFMDCNSRNTLFEDGDAANIPCVTYTIRAVIGWFLNRFLVSNFSA
jgi:hypothetical protein